MIRAALTLMALPAATLPPAMADSVAIGTVTVFFDGVPGDGSGETDWMVAILNEDAGAIFSGEDFNDDPVTPDGPNGGSGTLGYGLGAGPHGFGGASNDEFTITLKGIGNGGSQTGIINPGEHDMSNALLMRIVDDTSDFELFPGFVTLGEGVESADFAFVDPQIAFAAVFHSTTTNDGLRIIVNGVEINLHDYYPDDMFIDGDGFLGVLDPSGITGFTLVTDQLEEPNSIFEEFEMDDIQYAAVNTPPEIMLNGFDPQFVQCGDPYMESGAIALDLEDGDITGDIVIDASAVDTSTPGMYVVTYNVTDSGGLPAPEVTRTVNVEDTTAPVITLLGANPQQIECGDAYAELGATAADACDGDLTGAIFIEAGAVDTSTPGSYSVFYDVSDATGNAADQGVRTVIVEDNVAPIALCKDVVITLDGSGGSALAGQDIDNGSSDNCGIVSRTVSREDFTCLDIDVTDTVTLTVTDVSGNVDTCDAMVTVIGCDDGDACTRDVCDAGACTSTPLWTISEDEGGCMDDDPCTLDRCDRRNGTFACDNIFLPGNDDDFDGIPNHCDNCRFAFNPLQRDSDMPPDGFGDACDADKNNDCIVNELDFALFNTAFGLDELVCDFNGDGVVGMADFLIFLRLFGKPPGPSGLEPVCVPSAM